jgi:release factor glutamine methyltransferase
MRLPDGSVAAAVEASRRELADFSPTPGLDARILAGSALGLDASALIAYGENAIEPSARERLARLVQRRKSGVPVAYLTGVKEFYGLRLHVDARVLVPRPETEELVDLVLGEWRGRAPSILDLGTGSGAIACALARALPDAHITATDVSAGALEVAATNVEALSLGDDVELASGDLFDGIAGPRRFDVIVANLPYVGRAHLGELEPAVAAYEPEIALFAGEDGLDVYRRMLPAAPGRLETDGSLYMECSPLNAAALAEAASDVFGRLRVEVRRDLSGHERFVIARAGARRS